eukprot:PhM_4_TR7573/c0_g1_i2/m.29310/K02936/RP-L7Ae, RPL7A; large subunit ribosomal protein L7Ae
MPKEQVKRSAAASKAKPYNKGAAKKKEEVAAPSKNALFAARPRNFGLGGNVMHTRDVTRQVRWPLYVTRQRRLRVLQRRMKVPPAVNQFRSALDKATKKELLTLLKKYAPETAAQRKTRLQAAAKAGSGKAPARPKALTFGIREVTSAIENKKARLVLIAHDVDPIELVLWMPQLCHAQEVPYAIVKSKSQLGELVGFKTCAAVAVTELNSEDQGAFNKLLTAVNSKFTERFDEIRRSWGGLQQGVRAQFRAEQRRKAREAEGRR